MHQPNLLRDNEIGEEQIREINTTEIKETEVRHAINKTKTGKAPGIDEIPADLFKADCAKRTDARQVEERSHC